MAEKTTTKEEVKKDVKAPKNDSEKMAVIRTGGKQYLVREGDVVKIEKLPESLIKNGKVEFKEVLMISSGEKVEIGRPLISAKSVSAEVVEEGRDKKVSVVHYKSKSRYFKRNGHRQPFVKVKITKIA